MTTGAKTIAAVTEEFDLTETALRAWVRRAEADESKGTPSTLTTTERSESIELRKRIKRAEMERDDVLGIWAAPTEGAKFRSAS